jgi:SET domain-containing protein
MDLIFRQSAIHGIGGFAAKDIQNGERVIDYVGERIDRWESLRRCEGNNEYIFALSEEDHMDGNVEWNAARLINHSCEPNCEAVMEEGKIWIVARRRIAAGEEITFNYGFDLEDYREYPCRCGSVSCVGYIVAEEFFDHVRRQQALESERTPHPIALPIGWGEGEKRYNSTEQSR